MKIAEITITLLVLFTFTDVSSAGWERTFSEGDYAVGYYVIQTEDGGFLVAGETYSTGMDGVRSVYLVKTDSAGDTAWERTWGENSGSSSVAQVEDSGYIIAGYVSGDVYLIRANAYGDTVWTRSYGGDGRDKGSSVVQTTDGGYIIAGTTSSFLTHPTDSADIYLIKTDARGDTLWTRTYGGLYNDYGFSVKQTADGGFVVAGETYSFSGGWSSVYLVKVDSTGEMLWQRTYGGSYGSGGNSVIQSSDGRYIVAGWTYSSDAGETDVYLAKIDTDGDTLWTRTYGGCWNDVGCSVIQNTDGGYTIAGYTESFGAGAFDVYLVKTDAEGNLLWQRTYGESGEDYGSSVAQTGDNGYIIAGATNSFTLGRSDVYLVKTDSLGYVDTTAIGENISHKPREVAISAYPNPFNSSCCITVPEGAKLEIYNLRGRLVYKMPVSLPPANPYEIIWQPDKPIASGVYLIRAMTRNGRMMTKKLVLLK